jgi:hypothetical protein
MQKSEQTNDDQEWIERVGKTVYELACNCTNNDFIVKSSGPMLLECVGLAIEQHLEAILSKLRPIFEQILADFKARKLRKTVTPNRCYERP